MTAILMPARQRALHQGHKDSRCADCTRAVFHRETAGIMGHTLLPPRVRFQRQHTAMTDSGYEACSPAQITAYVFKMV